jgi:glycosyltransferase involved in cell wall biosynthesis
MNIGLVPTLNPSFGGSHQYSLAMLEAIGLLVGNNPDVDTYSLFIRPEEQQILSTLNSVGWSQVVVYASLSDRVRAALKTWVGHGFIRETVGTLRCQVTRGRFHDPDQVRRGSELGKWLRRHGIDWVLYTGTDSNSFESGVPYVMPVFDLQHRLQPEFPEVSAGDEWDEREYVFRNGTREALLILADSEVGKEDILEYYGPYGVTPDRVKVLPYLPAPYLSADVPPSERVRVRTAYRLPVRYLLYPAQLWPHKNHVRVVQALGLLKADHRPAIHVVLCGTHSGAIRTGVYRAMMREAQRLRVTEQLHYLGYVPNEAMSALYAEAVGVVLPTFFGPTNIPIIEAWLFGCPVLTSDIRGIREQVGEAGLLVDPRSVEAIAAGMERLWEEAGLRVALAQRGTHRLARYNRHDFCVRLADIVREANQRVAAQRTGTC